MKHTREYVYTKVIAIASPDKPETYVPLAVHDVTFFAAWRAKTAAKVDFVDLLDTFGPEADYVVVANSDDHRVVVLNTPGAILRISYLVGNRDVEVDDDFADKSLGEERDSVTFQHGIVYDADGKEIEAVKIWYPKGPKRQA